MKSYRLWFILCLCIFIILVVFCSVYKIWKVKCNSKKAKIKPLLLTEITENKTLCIESALESFAGFYSSIFFTFNHLLFALSHSYNFKINTDNWKYKSREGWTDYFEPFVIETLSQETSLAGSSIERHSHRNVLADYTIFQYKQVIPLIYRYNKFTTDFISSMARTLKLIRGQYDAIYIRRGDKIITGESSYISAGVYVDLLLLRNPNSKVVFVQTDDFGAIEEMREYICNKNLSLEIKTNCKETERGNFVSPISEKDIDRNYTSTSDANYAKKNKTAFTVNKTVDEFDSEEIFEHTLSILAGVDIVCQSHTCILDYKSNVARFIKLFHKNPEQVFNVLNPDIEIDYNKKICPAYSF